MEKSSQKILEGYKAFREKYDLSDPSLNNLNLGIQTQPEIMVVACSDSRVDPGILLQCDPGDLYVIRNLGSIIPPFEEGMGLHGVSAALEFGIRVLEVKQLILLSHSNCYGIKALLSKDKSADYDFIYKWVSIIDTKNCPDIDACAKSSLNQSYENCLTFPWIRERFFAGNLLIHRWFYDVALGKIFNYQPSLKQFQDLESAILL